MVIAQWLQPIMMHMLQGLSTASRLLEGTESKLVISSSVQSILTLLESSEFALGKGIALMFAKAMKASVHAPNSELYRIGDPCNQVYFVVAGKVAKMVTEGSRNTRVQVTADAEAYGLADVMQADACLGIDALYAGDTLHSRSAVAMTACVVASLSRRSARRSASQSHHPSPCGVFAHKHIENHCPPSLFVSSMSRLFAATLKKSNE